jgi:dTDP-glucose 4,6-dehydratase
LFTESTPIHTSSPYSASKASADLLVLSYIRTFKFPATISRCSNNYGPYQFPEKLIPVVISKALNNEKIPVYGTGENVRDWIHVHDHNTGIDKIIHQGKIGEVYNLGGRSEKQNIELVKLILTTLDKPYDLISFVTDRAGHDLRYAIDSTKAETELGWNRKYDFSDGMKETIEWYVNNQDWINDIKTGEYQRKYKLNR